MTAARASFALQTANNAAVQHQSNKTVDDANATCIGASETSIDRSVRRGVYRNFINVASDIVSEMRKAHRE